MIMADDKKDETQPTGSVFVPDIPETKVELHSPILDPNGDDTTSSDIDTDTHDAETDDKTVTTEDVSTQPVKSTRKPKTT